MTDRDEEENWGLAVYHALDVGAPVLALREEGGVLFVTTTKGTFPLDRRFFDD